MVKDPLVGKDVKVRVSRYSTTQIIEFSGSVLSCDRKTCIQLDYSGMLSSFEFCGISGGIYEIVDRSGTTLYRNDKVLKAYEKRLKTESQRDTLRAKGKFFI